MAGELDIRRFTELDIDHYMAFRDEFWPAYGMAGNWEIVRRKFFQHPFSTRCPGAGLYGCFIGGDLVGVMGAYPMPVTLDGVVYPGHMIVDWGVLDRFRDRPVSFGLLHALLALPGRKYGSSGSPASQAIMMKLGEKVVAQERITILRPFPAAALRLFRLAWHAQAAPLPTSGLAEPGKVDLLSPDQVGPILPPVPNRTAFVSRGPDFWIPYLRGRMLHGAVPLRITADRASATAVVRLLQVGTVRFARLLTVQFSEPTVRGATAVGKVLRGWLQRLNISAFMATLPDPYTEAMTDALGRITRTGQAHWWVLNRPGDAFGRADVDWWLTAADRDAIWGLVEHGAVDE